MPTRSDPFERSPHLGKAKPNHRRGRRLLEHRRKKITGDFFWPGLQVCLMGRQQASYQKAKVRPIYQ